jgi:MFS family permease
VTGAEELSTTRSRAAYRRFPSLTSKPFRRLLAAFAISTFGDWLYNIVLLVWIYDRTGSSAWVAVASIARIAPVILFSISAGDLADRYDRRTVMIVSDLLRAGTMFGLVSVAMFSGPPALAVGLVFVSAALGTPFLPCVDATLPTLVERDQLPSANAAITVIQYLSLAAGPAVGGLIALIGSPELVFGLNGLSFVGSALLISLLPRQETHEDVVEASPFRRVAEGLRTIAESKRVLALVACLPLTSFLPGTAYVLLVLVSERSLGLDAEGATFLYAAIGVGAIVTSWFSDRLTTLAAPYAVLIATNCLMGLAFAALGYVDQLVFAYVCCAAIGASTLIADVTAFTLLQKAIRQEYLGRVFGVVNALLYLGMAAGSLVAPFLERSLGLESALALVGITVAALISVLSLVLRGWDVTVAARPIEVDA